MRLKYLAAFGWLALNFIFNFFNKWVFPQFPFPAFILCCNNVIIFLVILAGTQFTDLIKIERPVLRQHMSVILLLAALHAFDLFLENTSLESVSLALNQIIKSTVPFFSLLLSIFTDRAAIRPLNIAATSLIVVGACLSAFRAPHMTTYGVVCSFGSAVLAAAKTNVAAVLLSDAHMSSIALTFITALPGALVLFPLFLFSEAASVFSFAAENLKFTLFVVLVTSVLSIAYDYVHYLLVQQTSALYSTLLGNVKCLVYVVVAIFRLRSRC